MPSDTIESTFHKVGRDLPNELLLQIFAGLGETDLYSVTLCSRRFNGLALPICLSHHGIPDPALGTLVLSGTQMNALAVLQHSLSFTSLSRLSCTFSTGDQSALTEVRRIDRMVSRLSHIDEITLDLAWLFTFREVSIPLNWIGWRDTMAVLLNRIVEKACTVLTVRGGHMPPRVWALLSPAQLKTEKTKRSDTRLKKFLGSIRKQRHSTEPHQHRRLSAEVFPRTSLKTINIHSPLLFCASLQDWTIKTLNISPITSLSLRYINMPASSWAPIFARISLPALSELSIRVRGFAFADLSGFLSRHPCITTLDLDYVGQQSQVDRLEKGTMPNLSAVSTRAGNLVRILQPAGAFPLLRSIFISAHMNQDMLQPLDFALLDRDLARLACRPATKVIALSLQLSGLFGCLDWLRVHGRERGRHRVERSLHCVKTLRLQTNWCFACCHTSLTLLPIWLALFPALRHVIFEDHSMTPDAELLFIRSIARTCPGMKVVTINGVDFDVGACVATSLSV